MKIEYRIKKMIVRFKHRAARKRLNYAFKVLSVEQLKVYNIVKEVAEKNNDAIRFDPKTEEILINIPDKLLVTMRGGDVRIDNSKGFMLITMPTEAYELLVEITEKEAHKDRRKLKKDVKNRLHSFLDNIAENELKNSENEHK